MSHDSEADRRDEARDRIVADAVMAVLKILRDRSVTYTYAERAFLQLAIAERLVRGVRLEAMSMMMRGETDTLRREADGD